MPNYSGYQQQQHPQNRNPDNNVPMMTVNEQSDQQFNYYPQQRYPSSASPRRDKVVGLRPTDQQQERDAYRRTANNRASTRNRPKRASYLMALGHLDVEETQRLTPSNDSVSNQPAQSRKKVEQNHLDSNRSDDNIDANHKSVNMRKQAINVNKHSTGRKYNSPNQSNGLLKAGTSGGDDSFIEHVASSNYHFDIHDSIFAHNDFKNSMSSKNKISSSHHKDSRGKFTQSYTEVTLPMKTSPAFDYILKDNKRRNKRYCLWLLYTSLMTVCIAIIIFCTTHLILRYRSN